MFKKLLTSLITILFIQNGFCQNSIKQPEIKSIFKTELNSNSLQSQFVATSKFSDFTQLINNERKYLDQTYGIITREVFVEAASTVTNIVTNRAQGGGCGLRYALCGAAVGFEGGLLLAACEAASAGIATPLCLAGAVVYAANGIADCRDRYCGVN